MRRIETHIPYTILCHIPSNVTVRQEGNPRAPCPMCCNIDNKEAKMGFTDTQSTRLHRTAGGGMEILLISAIFLCAAFSTVSAQGCYWTGACQSRWMGGCGSGRVAVDQSDDCHGLCPEPQYPSCFPLYTHFQCCEEEAAKPIGGCSKCENKIDLGDEYVCCSDCSNPSITNKNTKLGYCKTGAQLAIEFKPQEVFMWVSGPWMECSSPCDGGIKYRDVSCFGTLKDSPITHYPVDDKKCSFAEMPTSQEPCNMQSCTDLTIEDSKPDKRTHMSVWAIMLLILLSMATVAGLAYGGYILYLRQTSTGHGFVYVMLEAYS